MAALMLAMISLYHLCDYMRGPMSSPYYKALKIDKDTIGLARLFVGTPGALRRHRARRLLLAAVRATCAR